jgi:hypothetical protein
MKILKISLLFLILIAFLPALAQNSRTDSLKKIAKKDVRSFKLSKEDFKNFKQTRASPQAEYFKPNPVNISNPALTNDSGYVAAYRLAAYDKAKSTRSNTHYVLKGVEIIGISVLAAVFIALSLGSK